MNVISDDVLHYLIVQYTVDNILKQTQKMERHIVF